MKGSLVGKVSRITSDPLTGFGDALLHGCQVATKVLDAGGLWVTAMTLVQGGDFFQLSEYQWVAPLVVTTASAAGMTTASRRGKRPLSKA